MNDRLHVVSESTLLKNIPHRIQCDIPDPHTGASKTCVDSLTVVDMHANTPAAVDLNIDRITSLERTVCSNFACCGAQLPDLHALLEHFEEDHVVVLAPNGRRVYPPEGLRSVPLHPIVSPASSPASSRSSSMSPSSPSSPLTPFSSVPSSPSDLSSPTSGSFAKRKSSITVTPVYTPFTPSLPVDPAYPYPDTSEIVMAHDPSFEFPPDLFPPFALKSPISTVSSDEDEEMSDGSTLDVPLSPIPTFIYGTEKGQLLGAIPKHVRSTSSTEKIKIAVKALNSSVASSSTKSSKTKNRYIGTGSNPNLRRREKAYRCPTPRCTKSYLNPNGLKYHMEKGTCKIDETCEDGQEPIVDAMPVAPVNEVPSVASHSAPPLASTTDARMQPAPAQVAGTGSAPPSIPNLPNDGAHPGQSSNSPGEIPTRDAGSYYHHNNNLSTVPIHTHQQNHSSALASSPNVNFNEQGASGGLQGPPLQPASHQEGISFSIPCTPAPSYVPHRHSPSQLHSPLPHQNESQPQYHYPVPSYPQIVGPNALLAAGYTTYVQPYYQTDRMPTNFPTPHSEGCGPSFPPMTATVSSHSQ